ncbi:hypothetical protein D9758_007282 [Tetrapyrgos nigripes]|uniref:Carboxylesterase type B domain-containing protein n=1 Tax=Tetrapyrgos nigripes TaxID=182062 RepID=A0A8H5GB16_9AGAR|nr:hypothetical protein D9758_007282 [Tetrapyrgos nigripes]
MLYILEDVLVCSGSKSLSSSRPDLSIQDITALFVSLTNLSLSCYPDRLEYVDQVLGYAAEKLKEFTDSPDLHAQQTTSNLAALLVAPINSYQSVLTLLAIPNYVPLLSKQLFSTRRSIAHSIISSVLKNETVIEAPEDVDGVLELCHVLIKDQSDSATGGVNGIPPIVRDRRQPPYTLEREEMAEEQGWIARMLLQIARKHFDAGGERMRFTFPALITSVIKLCRRYKNREHLEDDWQSKVSTILKFARQLTSILATQVEAPTIALRLFLLAAQISDECGFEDLTYDLYVQAFSVYEDSISESRGQLQAITLIISTLSGAKVFGVDNYDTLITKAALHGAKLLKKSHQSTAVGLASHLWWQQAPPASDGDAPPKKDTQEKPKEDSSENTVKAYPHQDSKRVLECLQKTIRIANSAIEEIVKVQLYCDTLDHYLYYFDRGTPPVTPKFINNLVDLITSNIDGVSSPDVHPSQRAPPGLIEGVQTPEMITRHFRNTLYYIQRRKNAASEGSSPNDSRWDEVEVVGAMLKMGIVTIGSTTLVGRDIPTRQVEFFGGIPFAEPPVGSLRFKPPVFKDVYNEATLNATQFGLACLQFNMTLEQASEDCLTLNVFRPAGLAPDASLPVVIWQVLKVYGGGFDRVRSFSLCWEIHADGEIPREVQLTGTAAGLLKEVSNGHQGTPVILVSINYRLGPLGFPQGSEAEEKGALNLAIKDELTALEWVHKHIEEFGGDKDKVTVAGVSSGAIMSAILFLHPDTERLVRGGIFQSGSAATAPTRSAAFRQVTSWDQFVSSVPACANLAGTSDTFDCLVNADPSDILEGANASREAAIEGFPWVPTLDGPDGIFPDYPSKLFALGQYARIPFISATNVDEGTVFVDPTQDYTTDLIRANLHKNFSTPDMDSSEQNQLDMAIETILQLYPDDPSLGSPFGTGDNTFGLSPGFKRISAFQGDAFFLSQRRMWQQTMANDLSSGVQSYGYLFAQGTLATKLAPMFGILHGSDSHYLFNDTLVDTSTPGASEAGITFMDYLISFIDSLDPNDGKGMQRPQWSVYAKDGPVVLQIQAQNITEIPDTFRKEQTDFINSLPDIFHH